MNLAHLHDLMDHKTQQAPNPYAGGRMYLDTSPDAKIIDTAAITAFACTDRKFSASRFGEIMERLAAGGVNDVQHPSIQPIGSGTIFHVSQGKRGADSACVFFHIYAKQTNVPQAVGEEVVNISTQNQKCMVSIKFDGSLVQRIEIQDQEKLVFTYSGNSYRIVFDIVGIGYHTGGTSYKLIQRNHFVLNESISL